MVVRRRQLVAVGALVQTEGQQMLLVGERATPAALAATVRTRLLHSQQTLQLASHAGSLASTLADPGICAVDTAATSSSMADSRFVRATVKVTSLPEDCAAMT